VTARSSLATLARYCVAPATYIGVHAAFLYELLPIPGKGERWTDFKTRWHGYLDEVVSRFENQSLDIAVALALAVGITLVALANHFVELMPDRTLAYLVLFALPIGWRAVSFWRMRLHPDERVAPTASGTTVDATTAGEVGRARLSRKQGRR
jgi:hypothetical protein